MDWGWHEPLNPVSLDPGKDLSLFFSISSPCSCLCPFQRKRLRYSDLDFEVSAAKEVALVPSWGTDQFVPTPFTPLAAPELRGI